MRRIAILALLLACAGCRSQLTDISLFDRGPSSYVPRNESDADYKYRAEGQITYRVDYAE